MKKSISFSIYSLVFCLPLLFSCSEEILEGDRYKEMAFVEPKRHILIEDFTGQKCRNCPEAHQVIDELQALYGDYVIAVAIHADLGSNGVFGIAEGKDTNTIGLMQPEGDEYAMRWGVSFLPAGLINRNSKPLKHTEWAAYARQALAREAQATIALSSEVVDNTLCVNTEILSATNYSDAAILMNAIKTERQRELVGEGFRLTDLKRWNEGVKRENAVQNRSLVLYPGAETTTALTKSADDYRMVWPIPKSETDVNPQIKNQQNPGY